MAKMSVFTVYDRKVNAFMGLFMAPNRGSMVREISDVMSQANHPWARHADDYDLYLVGEFDTATGKLESRVAENVMRLDQMKSEPAGGEGEGVRA